MADPVVHITSGVPDSGTGNITTLGQTLVDGANPSIGATTDAAVTAGATGSLLAKLRSISRDLVANIVLATGANIIGKVTTDQTTHGTTDLVAADVIKLGGATINLGAGATSTGTLRTTLASDSPGIITTGSQAAPSSSYLSVVAAGDIAAAAPDSGNPLKIGGVGKTANPTAVSDGQRVNALFDKLGKQVVVGAIRDLKGRQKTTITASTSETTIITAVASTFLDLYGLILANTGATTTKVDIRDTTGGSIITTIEVPTLETRGFMLPVDSALAQASVNTNWTAQCGSSTSSLEVTALFSKNL